MLFPEDKEGGGHTKALIITAAILVALAALLFGLPIRVRVLGTPALGWLIRVTVGRLVLGEESLLPPTETPEASGTPSAPRRKKKKKKLINVSLTKADILTTLRVLKALLGQVYKALRHARITRLYIRARCGGENAAAAAIRYGQACAAIYPLVEEIQDVFRCAPKAVETDLTCSFEEEDSRVDFELVLTLRLLFFIIAVIGIVSDLVPIMVDEVEEETEE